MTQEQYIIRRKLNILELGEKLGNITLACKRLGVIVGSITMTLKKLLESLALKVY